MNKEEMICKNCKYHYIEEISFYYPQSCCDKRKAVIEEWFNCNDFEYSDKYIEQLQQENQQLKIQISAREEEYKKLEDNWEELKKWLYEEHYLYIPEIAQNSTYQEVLDKMEKIERGLKDVEN